MGVLEGLEPAKVFDFFEQISDIPRGSGNTQQILSFLENFARERSLAYSSDEAGNIVIYAKGTPGYEKSPTVILQGHMDMVCQKRPDIEHDFTKDRLDLTVDGDWLYAEGTTLGGDDGVAIAYMLAILDDPSVAHPPLECLITTGEEIGLIGAEAFDTAKLKGRRMINLDSEKEGVLTAGCAGGVRIDSIFEIERAKLKGLPIIITISGLKGGHSGEMINKYRANADKLMGRLLFGLEDVAAYSLASFSGGDKDNAIPFSAKAYIVSDEEDFPAIRSFVSKFEGEVLAEYRGIDDGITISVEKGTAHRMEVLTPASQDTVINFLMFAPHGVRQMSGTTPGLVETSSNLGIARVGDKEFAAVEHVRSSVTASKNALATEIRALTELLHGSTHRTGDYGAWEYKAESPLRNTIVEVYKALNEGRAPEVNVIHGGLECGIFATKIRGLDAVSLGPDIVGIHTYDEKLSISSTERTYKLLLKVLEALK